MFAVLDTNHLREVALGGRLAQQNSRRASQSGAEVFTTIITVQEATAGWLALINRLKAGEAQVSAYTRFQATVAALRHFDILPFDKDAARAFHLLSGRRLRVGTMDLKIAAICMAHEAVLLTRNVSDFAKIPELRVMNWLDP